MNDQFAEIRKTLVSNARDILDTIESMVDYLDGKEVIDLSNSLIKTYQLILHTSTRHHAAGFVYVGTDGIHGYKIGCTINLSQREKELQCGNPSYKMVVYRHENDMNVAVTAIHKQYQQYGYSGEWFSFPSHTIQEFVDAGFRRYK